MKNKYSSFFTALKRHPHLSKEQAVQDFTKGRTSSLKALDYWELQELVRGLNNVGVPQKPVQKEYAGGEKANRMRRAIIAIFRNMDKQPADAILWAEKQGAKGQKKRFNDYTTGELHILIDVAEKVQRDWEAGIRKRATNTMT